MPIKSKILILDDSDFDREVLSLVLEKQGYDLIFLNNGLDILSIIEKEKPDLLLLDLLLPEIHGHDVLKLIRQTYSAIEFPIIIITSITDNRDAVKALRAGANDYILKPIDSEITQMRILTQLKLVQLSQEMAHLQQLSTLQSIIVTYNHQIKNPLTTAIGLCDLLEESKETPKEVTNIKKQLWRINDIVSEISGAIKSSNIEYEKYSKFSDMIKIKRDPRP